MTWGARAMAALLAVCSAAAPAYAVRTNVIRDLQRLIATGQYEEALFYLRSTLDMTLALHAAWSGAPYDPQMDGVYPQLDRVYGPGQHVQMETRVDRRYWGIINNQRKAVAEVMAKARLSEEQLDRLDRRVRVYVEHHMAPEFDETGDFFFQRKAWIFERTGLFLDASFRRRLTGYYDERVCAPYYATMAAELAGRGQKAEADAYRRKAEWYRAEAVREFRRSNGDRLLSLIQEGKTRQRLSREQVTDLLKAGLKSQEGHARFAAVLALADIGELELARFAAGDADPEIRALIVSLQPPPPPAGLKPGLTVEFTRRAAQPAKTLWKVLRRVDVGFKGNDRFPEALCAYWDKEEAVPPSADGPFTLHISGKLQVPRDGSYRFYIKTPPGARATVRVGGAEGLARVVSPEDDKNLLYAEQRDWGGGALYRIDFSEPVALRQGLTDLEIDCQGDNTRGRFGRASLQLFWSSDAHVMELVPASALWHAGD